LTAVQTLEVDRPACRRVGRRARQRGRRSSCGPRPGFFRGAAGRRSAMGTPGLETIEEVRPGCRGRRRYRRNRSPRSLGAWCRRHPGARFSGVEGSVCTTALLRPRAWPLPLDGPPGPRPAETGSAGRTTAQAADQPGARPASRVSRQPSPARHARAHRCAASPIAAAPVGGPPRTAPREAPSAPRAPAHHHSRTQPRRVPGFPAGHRSRPGLPRVGPGRPR